MDYLVRVTGSNMPPKPFLCVICTGKNKMCVFELTQPRLNKNPHQCGVVVRRAGGRRYVWPQEMVENHKKPQQSHRFVQNTFVFPRSQRRRRLKESKNTKQQQLLTLMKSTIVWLFCGWQPQQRNCWKSHEPTSRRTFVFHGNTTAG